MYLPHSLARHARHVSSPALANPRRWVGRPARRAVDAPGGIGARPMGAHRWSAVWIAPAGVLLLLGAALTSVARSDSGRDVLGVCRSISADLLRLRWQYLLVLIVLAALHYLATAIAARSASGLRLPIGETLLVELAASAANRLTPAGLGGAAVNARYFTRRGLDGGGAVGAVGLLSLVSAVTDVAVLAVIVLAGRWLGVGGAGGELALLLHRVRGLIAPLRSPLLWLLLGIPLALVIAAKRGKWVRAGERVRRAWQPAGRLARCPSRLGTLLAASGSTTLILGFAFAAATAMVPGPRPAAGLGGLLVAFMLGAAAGSAVPVPAGIGSTETALVGVLVGVQVPSSHAVEVVLIFRLMTFWLPAVGGVLATRQLRRRSAI